MDERETIAAVATAPGRGGVAVVRVSGPEAFAVAMALTGRTVDATQAGRFFHANIFDGARKVIDEGLVLVFKGPRSYTGEDVVEFQTHGGSITPRRVLEACFAAGARLARRGEFTLRAFLNGRLDLTAAEAVIDLVDARTERAADDAVARLDGVQGRKFLGLYESALDLSSRLEHALDFSEDELPAGYVDDVQNRVLALRADILASLATAREGKMLREGALVVLAGPPNAGKSSLLNALLGERRAIVSAEAGTTRDSIEEWFEVDGWPVRLVDTAGLRETDNAIEGEGVERAEALIRRADVVLALDCEFPGALKIHSKCDLARGEGLNVSAVTGEGLDELKHALAVQLTRLAAKVGDAGEVDVTIRQRELLEEANASLDDVGGPVGGLCPAQMASISFSPLSTAPFDLVLAANAVRRAADSLGRLVGKVYTDDLLDSLFSRFCIGK